MKAILADTAIKKALVSISPTSRQSQVMLPNRQIIPSSHTIPRRDTGTGRWKRFANKSVQDAAHREIFRQIEYKARWWNRNFVFVDRWYPSSQLCSSCGYRHEELSLRDRIWKCPGCGVWHDRDHNAAKNVRDEGMRILLAVGHTERLNACGASVRPAKAGRSQ
jgi:transposase